MRRGGSGAARGDGYCRRREIDQQGGKRGRLEAWYPDFPSTYARRATTPGSLQPLPKRIRIRQPTKFTLVDSHRAVGVAVGIATTSGRGVAPATTDSDISPIQHQHQHHPQQWQWQGTRTTEEPMPRTRLLYQYHPAFSPSLSPKSVPPPPPLARPATSPQALTPPSRTRVYTCGTPCFGCNCQWTPELPSSSSRWAFHSTQPLLLPFSSWHNPQWHPIRTSHHRSSTRLGDGGALPQRPRPRMQNANTEVQSGLKRAKGGQATVGLDEGHPPQRRIGASKPFEGPHPRAQPDPAPTVTGVEIERLAH